LRLGGGFELGPLLGFDALGLGEGCFGHRTVLDFENVRLRLLAAAFAAVSLFVSCLTVHPVVAAIGAFATLLVMVLAGEAAGDGLRARGWTVAASLAQVVSPIKSFEPFGKGMLDTYAAACLILLTALFLALAIRQLDAQRLRG